MIKKFKDENLNYEESKLIFEDKKKVQISGKVEIVRVGNNFLIKLTDDYSKNSINQLVFPGSPLFAFFKVHVGEKNPCVADVQFVTNVVNGKTYTAIEIHNIHMDVLSDEEKKILQEKKDEEAKSSSAQVSAAIKSIGDPLLKRLCLNVYRNKEIVDKIMLNPATEHSAYNEKQGIIKMIADTINLTNTITNAMNSNFPDGTLNFNLDLMKTAAILCNVGRAFMLEYDETGAINKTESGIIENEILITRDIITLELHQIAQIKTPEGELAYNINNDTIKELMHMLATCKSKLEYNASILPRTKHAMLMADIVSMVFTKGLFENLEKNSDGEKFVKAYDAGRNYVIF